MSVEHELPSDGDQVHLYTMRELAHHTAELVESINQSGMPAVITQSGRFVAIVYPLEFRNVESGSTARFLEDDASLAQLEKQSVSAGVSTTQNAAAQVGVALAEMDAGSSPEGVTCSTSEEAELVRIARAQVTQLQHMLSPSGAHTDSPIVLYADSAMENIRCLPAWTSAELLQINSDELTMAVDPSAIEGYVEKHVGLMWRRAVRRAELEKLYRLDEQEWDDDMSGAHNYISVYRRATPDEIIRLNINRPALTVVAVFSNRDLAVVLDQVMP
ncbi:hypothetical protein ACXPWS_09295 [Mycobacterium sp. BMJ-28]